MLDVATLLQALRGELAAQEVARLSRELSSLPLSSVLTLVAQADIHIRGNGNIVGDHNTSIVVQGEGEELGALLREALMRGQALHQLRAPIGDFVGRSKEMKELVTYLEENKTSLCAVSGMGGVGKTELVLKVAQELRADYPDAQLFVDMRGTDELPREPGDALASCVRAFVGPQVPLPAHEAELGNFYRSQLAGKRVLLVLDNARDAQQVRPLLPPDGCAVLITSRSAIALPGLWNLTLPEMALAEAQELLRLVAADITPDVASEIAFLCGCLPLAVRAAGSLLSITPDLKPATYALQLSDERTRLKRLGVEGVDLGVEASFNLSYARLPRDSQKAFARLSVFIASFDTQAVERVFDDDSHLHLSDLVRRSLIQYNSQTERYRLHDLMRLYAHRLHENFEEQDIDLKRHAIYFGAVLDGANSLYVEGEEKRLYGVHVFHEERPNIEAGYAWAVSHAMQDDDASQLCLDYVRAGTQILFLRQRPEDLIAWLESALIVSRHRNDRQSEQSALNNLGIAYKRTGELRHAVELYKQALKIAQELADKEAECMTVSNMGMAYFELGEVETSAECHKRQLKLAKETRSRTQESNALGNLGTIYSASGNPGRALKFYKRQLELAREAGDLSNEGNALNNMGIAYKQFGEWDYAIELGHQALSIARAVGDPRHEYAALSNIGQCYMIVGEFEDALEFLDQALFTADEIGETQSRGSTLDWISQCLIRLGRKDDAIKIANKAIEILDQVEHHTAEVVRSRLAQWQLEI